jgi:hypothetical protein
MRDGLVAAVAAAGTPCGSQPTAAQMGGATDRLLPHSSRAHVISPWVISNISPPRRGSRRLMPTWLMLWPRDSRPALCRTGATF